MFRWYDQLGLPAWAPPLKYYQLSWYVFGSLGALLGLGLTLLALLTDLPAYVAVFAILLLVLLSVSVWLMQHINNYNRVSIFLWASLGAGLLLTLGAGTYWPWTLILLLPFMAWLGTLAVFHLMVSLINS